MGVVCEWRVPLLGVPGMPLEKGTVCCQTLQIVRVSLGCPPGRLKMQCHTEHSCKKTSCIARILGVA